MGRPKLLLPWGDSTIVARLIDTWRQAGAEQIAVVCAPDNHSLFDEIDRAAPYFDDKIINPEPCRGMFSSIQCAARWPRWKHDLTHLAFCLGDQPHLRNETLEALLNFSAENPENLVQPSSRNRPRHPVVMPKSVFKKLDGARETDLRAFLKSHQYLARSISCNDPGLDLDIDTPADYEQALKLVYPDAQHAR